MTDLNDMKGHKKKGFRKPTLREAMNVAGTMVSLTLIGMTTIGLLAASSGYKGLAEQSGQRAAKAHRFLADMIHRSGPGKLTLNHVNAISLSCVMASDARLVGRELADASQVEVVSGFAMSVFHKGKLKLDWKHVPQLPGRVAACMEGGLEDLQQTIGQQLASAEKQPVYEDIINTPVDELEALPAFKQLGLQVPMSSQDYWREFEAENDCILYDLSNPGRSPDRHYC